MTECVRSTEASEDRLQGQSIEKADYGTERSTDEHVNERLAQAALAPHCRKRFTRSSKHHLQRFDEGAEKSSGVTFIPRQPASGRGRRRSCSVSDHRWWRLSLRWRCAGSGCGANDIRGELTKL